MCGVPPTYLCINSNFNLAQLVSSSVALPAMLVEIIFFYLQLCLPGHGGFQVLVEGSPKPPGAHQHQHGRGGGHLPGGGGHHPVEREVPGSFFAL